MPEFPSDGKDYHRMHIPDGFLSPQTYLPAYGLSAAAWSWSFYRAKKILNERMIARTGMITVFALFASMLSLPVPGGSSVHLSVLPLMTLLFGLPVAHLAFTAVLLIQAMLFGAGGITSLGANAVIMGFLGGAAVVILKKATSFAGETASVFLAVTLSIMVSAVVFALLLGIQPLIASDSAGAPLFFPFDYTVTVPAVTFAHLWLAPLEGAITAFVYPRLKDILGTGDIRE